MTTDTTVSMGQEIRDIVGAVSKAVGLPAKDVETGIKNALRYTPHDATLEDRYDILHDIAVALLETRPTTGAYASGVARNTVGKWTERFFYRNHDSLDVDTDNPEMDAWYKDMLVGSIEFEARSCGDMDGQRLWDRLPGERIVRVVVTAEGKEETKVTYTGLKGIVQKRLRGARLSAAERQSLARHRKALTGILW